MGLGRVEAGGLFIVNGRVDYIAGPCLCNAQTTHVPHVRPGSKLEELRV